MKARRSLTIAILIVVVIVASTGHLVSSAAPFDSPLLARSYLPLVSAAARVYLPGIVR